MSGPVFYSAMSWPGAGATGTSGNPAAGSSGSVTLSGTTPVTVYATLAPSLTTLVTLGLLNLSGTPGLLTVVSVDPGKSFTVKSTSPTDTSTISWLIL